MHNLVWLASYPKSGNTWLRLLLNGYDVGVGKTIDVNRIDSSLHSGGRELFDRVIGVEASELTPSEIDRYRPYVYRQLAVEHENPARPLFIKVHDRFYCNTDGAPVFPPETTRMTIYIVRNPLAIVPSFANHYSQSIEMSIDNLAQQDMQLAAPGDRLKPQLHQPMGTWSAHVCSWLDQTELPVHVVRYEDLHADPHTAFTRILEAVGMPPDPPRVAWAVEQARFEHLQNQETQAGFHERLMGAARFFRKGRPDSWREELTPAQIQRVVDTHGAVMSRFDYLP